MTDGWGGIRIDPSGWESAIADTDGPQIVVAGPGTGKTDFLVRRAAHLIANGKARPAQIVALTFSRRAAAELGRRISVSTGGAMATVATFHSFANRILETHGPRSAIGTRPSLLTGLEQVSLVARLLGEESPKDWPLPYRPLLSGQTLAEDVADFMMRCRERLLRPEDVARLAIDRPVWTSLASFMTRYEAALSTRGRIDYGGLLAEAVETLGRPEVAIAIAGQYPYVLVDEYQDTTRAQAAMLERLTRPHRNITVTGDPNQSIYSFRGTDLGNVAEFQTSFRHLDGSPARRLILTTSFRVPAEILAGARRVMAREEPPGVAGELQPASHSGRVDTFVFDQASAEAEWIATQVERLHLEEGYSFSRIAVLLRSTRRFLPELSRALERRRIPHRIPDQRLVDHPAVRLVFDLVEASAAERSAGAGITEEADRAMRRLMLGPLLSLPLAKERDLLRRRRRTGAAWAQVLADHLAGSGAIAALLSDSSWATAWPAAAGFWHFWSTIPQLIEMVGRDDLPDFRLAWASFSRALERQQERDSAVTLLDFMRMSEREDFEVSPLLTYEAAAGETLTLTTLHQAKGLEFDVVFIADASEGSFPDLRRSSTLIKPDLSVIDSGVDTRLRLQSRLHEEMRLAYTAMTRARIRVVWTATGAAIDEKDRRPSRFLLAASGLPSFDQIGAPAPEGDLRPLTPAEAQAWLRRTLTDPGAVTVERLAALTVLAAPPRGEWSAQWFSGARERGPDHGIVSPSIRLSPSQGEAYSKCPRRYALERRLGASDAFSPYAHFGSLIHQVLEGSERSALANSQPHADRATALAVLDQVWAAGADFGSPVLNEAWKGRGADLICRLYDKWPGGKAVVKDVERTLYLEIDGVPWSGRADRIESHALNQLRVVDYKTTTTQPSTSDAGRSLQLGFYVLAAANDPELMAMGKPTAAQFWHPMASGKQPIRSLDFDHLAEVVDVLKEIGERILNEDFPPTPGSHCRQCPVRLICPAWPEGREAYGA